MPTQVCPGLGQRSASGILPLNVILIFPEGSVFVSFPIALNQYSDKSSLEEKVQSVMQGRQGSRSLKQSATLHIRSSIHKWCHPQWVCLHASVNATNQNIPPLVIPDFRFCQAGNEH